jgi:hypothetical protein
VKQTEDVATQAKLGALREIERSIREEELKLTKMAAGITQIEVTEKARRSTGRLRKGKGRRG